MTNYVCKRCGSDLQIEGDLEITCSGFNITPTGHIEVDYESLVVEYDCINSLFCPTCWADEEGTGWQLIGDGPNDYRLEEDDGEPWKTDEATRREYIHDIVQECNK